jgi:hypothetical protein
MFPGADRGDFDSEVAASRVQSGIVEGQGGQELLSTFSRVEKRQFLPWNGSYCAAFCEHNPTGIRYATVTRKLRVESS